MIKQIDTEVVQNAIELIKIEALEKNYSPSESNVVEIDTFYLPFTHVERTIELIRDSFDGSTIVYSSGSCVKLAMILKHLYPQGKILWDLSHALFEYDGICFDINGRTNKTENHVPIEDYGILAAHRSMNLKYNSICTPIPEDVEKEYEPYLGWCNVEGCDKEGYSGGNVWRDTGYWTVCSKHSQDHRDGKAQPKMKQSAIDREASRLPNGRLPIPDETKTETK